MERPQSSLNNIGMGARVGRFISIRVGSAGRSTLSWRGARPLAVVEVSQRDGELVPRQHAQA
eukprot:scaffold222403_cov31-Tisochrysis_lutea.AAC.2